MCNNALLIESELHFASGMLLLPYQEEGHYHLHLKYHTLSDSRHSFPPKILAKQLLKLTPSNVSDTTQVDINIPEGLLGIALASSKLSARGKNIACIWVHGVNTKGEPDVRWLLGKAAESLEASPVLPVLARRRQTTFKRCHKQAATLMNHESWLLCYTLV